MGVPILKSKDGGKHLNPLVGECPPDHQALLDQS